MQHELWWNWVFVAELENQGIEVNFSLSLLFPAVPFGCDIRLGRGSHQNQQADKSFNLDLKKPQNGAPGWLSG